MHCENDHNDLLTNFNDLFLVSQIYTNMGVNSHSFYLKSFNASLVVDTGNLHVLFSQT